MVVSLQTNGKTLTTIEVNWGCHNSKSWNKLTTIEGNCSGV